MLSDFLLVLLQQTPTAPAPVTIAVPENLGQWVLTAAGGGIVLATFGSSAVKIVRSAGDNIPRLLDEAAKRREIETSALSDMQKALEEMRKLVQQLREDLLKQGGRHDQEIEELRGAYKKMTQQAEELSILLSSAATHIKALEEGKDMLERERAEERRLREQAEHLREQAEHLREQAERERKQAEREREQAERLREQAERERDEYKSKWELTLQEKEALAVRLQKYESAEGAPVKVPPKDKPPSSSTLPGISMS